MSSNFVESFGSIEDKRVLGRSIYPLLEILLLCISAILSGAEGWEAAEDFGVAKLAWLRNYLPYAAGIPRHDTVARVIARISPKALRDSFVSWVRSVTELTNGEVVAIDGKQTRRSYNKKSGKNALHMVSTWACANGVVLAQEKTADKSNEITAIPKLLEILSIKDCIVTIDAMGTQKEIAEKIIKADADY